MEIHPSISTVVKGFSGTRDAISGSRSASLVLDYPARFWIDQEIKESLGHTD